MSVQQPVLSSCPPTNVRVASLLPGQEGVAVHAVNREYGRASTPSMLVRLMWAMLSSAVNNKK
jgi:hypothetical protein